MAANVIPICIINKTKCRPVYYPKLGNTYCCVCHRCICAGKSIDVEFDFASQYGDADQDQDW